MKKKITITLIFAMLIILIAVLAACSNPPEKVTVSFESNGGNAVAPITVDKESVLAELPTPERTGYTFAGWYKDVELTASWDLAADKVSADITLYAKWTDNNATPGDTDPGDTDPGDTDPGDPEPGETDPGDPEPGDPEPGNPESGSPLQEQPSFSNSLDYIEWRISANDRYQYIYKDADSPENNLYTERFWTGNSGVVALMNENNASVSGTSIRAGINFGFMTYGGYLFANPLINEARSSAVDATLDLSGAESLTFWVKTDAKYAGLGVTFYVGGAPNDSLENTSIVVKLRAQWTKYTIDLSGKDLSRVASGFGWSAGLFEGDNFDYVLALYGEGNYDMPLEFEMDEIRYNFAEPRVRPVFVNSYVTPTDVQAAGLMRNVSYSYDTACTIIALATAGRYTSAARLADALILAIENDRAFTGRVRNAYAAGYPVGYRMDNEQLVAYTRMPGFWDFDDTDTYLEDAYANGTTVGNTAFVILALISLYENSPTPNAKHLQTAVTLADFLLTLEAPTGGIKGGYSGHDTEQQLITYLSVEHNIDSRTAFLKLADIVGGAKAATYNTAAEGCLQFILSMYNSDGHYFYSGTNEDGITPNTGLIPLDTNVWSYLNGIIDYLPDAEIADIISLIENNYGVNGGFSFQNTKDGIFAEGSASVGLLYKMLGMNDKYAAVKDTLDALRLSNGGMYATDVDILFTGYLVEGTGELSSYFRWESMAPVAWYVMLKNGVNPFDISGISGYVGAGTAGLAYEAADDGYIVTGYSGTETDVTVPKYYKGLPITGIKSSEYETTYWESQHKGGYYGYNTSASTETPLFTDAVSVSLPSTVRIIGEYAFANNPALTSVTLRGESELIGIAAYAFHRCLNLTEFDIPAGVTGIGAFAFYVCLKIQSVVIPSGLKVIQTGTWYGCYGINSITMPEEGNLLEIGWDAFYHAGYYGTGFAIAIPASVVTVAGHSFNIAKVNALTFGENSNLNYIGPEAFRLTQITSVVLPDSLKVINGFDYCTKLTDVTMGSDVESIAGFDGCSKLTNFRIGGKVKRIGYNAFAYCSSLTEIYLPDSLESIGEMAFYGNIGLTSIYIPRNVSSIGERALDGEKIKTITVANENGNYKSIDGVLFSKDGKTLEVYPRGRTGAYTIPEGVVNIGEFAFYRRDGLTEVTIANSVENIGLEAFGDSGLKEILIPAGVKTIGGWAFYCDGLTDIKVAVGNTTYKDIDGVLFSADGKTLIEYPTGRSGGYTIPDGVESIGEFAFYWSGLTGTLIIPEGVTSIGHSAFVLCGITSIVIPKTITDIDNMAFNNGQLKNVYYGCADEEEWNALISSIGYGNTELTSATVYYYSAESKIGCWHFVNDVPTLW
ncbi:MAG: leucine-rich repeat protein [Clostridiaceae bacterium]|jgi:uncharacterized repeat protein (TIGR02543 family)|nr:leucine-rich repeat protein [Clostridiaceae bacterium]